MSDPGDRPPWMSQASWIPRPRKRPPPALAVMFPLGVAALLAGRAAHGAPPAQALGLVLAVTALGVTPLALTRLVDVAGNELDPGYEPAGSALYVRCGVFAAGVVAAAIPALGGVLASLVRVALLLEAIALAWPFLTRVRR